MDFVKIVSRYKFDAPRMTNLREYLRDNKTWFNVLLDRIRMNILFVIPRQTKPFVAINLSDLVNEDNSRAFQVLMYHADILLEKDGYYVYLKFYASSTTRFTFTDQRMYFYPENKDRMQTIIDYPNVSYQTLQYSLQVPYYTQAADGQLYPIVRAGKRILTPLNELNKIPWIDKYYANLVPIRGYNNVNDEEIYAVNTSQNFKTVSCTFLTSNLITLHGFDGSTLECANLYGATVVDGNMTGYTSVLGDNEIYISNALNNYIQLQENSVVPSVLTDYFTFNIYDNPKKISSFNIILMPPVEYAITAGNYLGFSEQALQNLFNYRAYPRNFPIAICTNGAILSPFQRIQIKGLLSTFIDTNVTQESSQVMTHFKIDSRCQLGLVPSSVMQEVLGQSFYSIQDNTTQIRIGNGNFISELVEERISAYRRAEVFTFNLSQPSPYVKLRIDFPPGQLNTNTMAQGSRILDRNSQDPEFQRYAGNSSINTIYDFTQRGPYENVGTLIDADGIDYNGGSLEFVPALDDQAFVTKVGETSFDWNPGLSYEFKYFLIYEQLQPPMYEAPKVELTLRKQNEALLPDSYTTQLAFNRGIIDQFQDNETTRIVSGTSQVTAQSAEASYALITEDRFIYSQCYVSKPDYYPVPTVKELPQLIPTEGGTEIFSDTTLDPVYMNELMRDAQQRSFGWFRLTLETGLDRDKLQDSLALLTIISWNGDPAFGPIDDGPTTMQTKEFDIKNTNNFYWDFEIDYTENYEKYKKTMWRVQFKTVDYLGPQDIQFSLLALNKDPESFSEFSALQTNYFDQWSYFQDFGNWGTQGFHAILVYKDTHVAPMVKIRVIDEADIIYDDQGNMFGLTLESLDQEWTDDGPFFLNAPFAASTALRNYRIYVSVEFPRDTQVSTVIYAQPNVLTTRNTRDFYPQPDSNLIQYFPLPLTDASMSFLGTYLLNENLDQRPNVYIELDLALFGGKRDYIWKQFEFFTAVAYKQNDYAQATNIQVFSDNAETYGYNNNNPFSLLYNCFNTKEEYVWQKWLQRTTAKFLMSFSPFKLEAFDIWDYKLNRYLTLFFK